MARVRVVMLWLIGGHGFTFVTTVTEVSVVGLGFVVVGWARMRGVTVEIARRSREIKSVDGGEDGLDRSPRDLASISRDLALW